MSTPGIALLPAPGDLVQALVGQQLERLVADLGEAHVRDPAGARAGERGDPLLEVVDVGDQRVDHDDELGPGLDRDVEVGGRHDAAVDQLAVLDLDRLVDHRQRAGGADRLGDRDVVPALGPEHDPLARVEVGGGQVELVGQQAEVVGAVRVGEDRPHVALDPLARVEPRGQRLGQPDDEVDRRHLAEVADQAARHLGQAAGTAAAAPLAQELARSSGAAASSTRASGNGVGTCWTITRIISSGVIAVGHRRGDERRRRSCRRTRRTR